MSRTDKFFTILFAVASIGAFSGVVASIYRTGYDAGYRAGCVATAKTEAISRQQAVEMTADYFRNRRP